jgi:hypothetical protein
LKIVFLDHVFYQLQFCIDASVGINILISKYKGEGEEGCGLSETFVMQIKESTTICIGASVGIDILIPKYKGEGEEGCGLSETFFMQIKEWGSASWSVRLFLEVGCGYSSYSSSLYFWRTKSAFCGEV